MLSMPKLTPPAEVPPDTSSDLLPADCLTEPERLRLRELIRSTGLEKVAAVFGVSPQTVARSLAGLPLRRATVVALRVRFAEQSS
jgi:hypothetical protein